MLVVYFKKLKFCRGLGGVSQASLSQEPTWSEAHSYLLIKLNLHSIASFHILFLFFFKRHCLFLK